MDALVSVSNRGILFSMDVQLDPQKQKAFEAAAKAEGKDPGTLLCELVERYLDERENGAPVPKKKGWLKKVEGSFADDPAFDEVVKLGEAFRKSVE